MTSRIVENPLVFQHIPSGSLVLDIGSYTSSLALSLASLGCRVVTVDPKGYPFEHSNLDNYNCLFPMNIFDSDLFEYVTCISTLEHIAAKKRFLRGVRRVMGKDGKFLVSFPITEPPRGCKDYITLEEVNNLFSIFQSTKSAYYVRENNCWRNCRSEEEWESYEVAIVFMVVKK